MPFYEYQCESCGHHLEALQKITDKPVRKCPECGKARLKRLMSAPVFRLKGSGWYETDFKSDAEAKRNLAGEKEPTESKAEASDAKTADKPADKATDKSAEKAAEKPAAKAESNPAGTAKAKPAAKSTVKTPAKTSPAKAAKKPAPRKAASRRR